MGLDAARQMGRERRRACFHHARAEHASTCVRLRRFGSAACDAVRLGQNSPPFATAAGTFDGFRASLRPGSPPSKCASGISSKHIYVFLLCHEIRIHYAYIARTANCNCRCQETLVMLICKSFTLARSFEDGYIQHGRRNQSSVVIF